MTLRDILELVENGKVYISCITEDYSVYIDFLKYKKSVDSINLISGLLDYEVTLIEAEEDTLNIYLKEVEE